MRKFNAAVAQVVAPMKVRFFPLQPTTVDTTGIGLCHPPEFRFPWRVVVHDLRCRTSRFSVAPSNLPSVVPFVFLLVVLAEAFSAKQRFFPFALTVRLPPSPRSKPTRERHCGTAPLFFYY